MNANEIHAAPVNVRQSATREGQGFRPSVGGEVGQRHYPGVDNSAAPSFLAFVCSLLYGVSSRSPAVSAFLPSKTPTMRQICFLLHKLYLFLFLYCANPIPASSTINPGKYIHPPNSQGSTPDSHIKWFLLGLQDKGLQLRQPGIIV